MERENTESGKTAGCDEQGLSDLRRARFAARGCATLLEAVSALAGQSLGSGAVTHEALGVLSAMLLSAESMAEGSGRGESARWTLGATSEVLRCEGFENVSPGAFEWLSEQVMRAVAVLDEELGEAGEAE